MKDKITQFKQGATIWHQYVDITYAGVVPTTLSGLQFFVTYEEYDTKTERINLTNVDMTLDDNGGSPILTIPVQTASLTEGVLYDYQLWVVDPTYGKHTLDEYFLKLGHKVPDAV